MSLRSFSILSFRSLVLVLICSLPGWGRSDSRKYRIAYHRVRPGENLTKIAARYGTDINDIVRLNRIRNRNRIPAGSVLKISMRRSSAVRKRKKNATHWIRGPLGQTWIKVPVGYSISPAKRKIITGSAYTLRMYSRDFVQGNAAYAELLPSKKAHITSVYGNFAGIPVQWARHGWGYSALIPFSPSRKPGRYLLKLYLVSNGKRISKSHAISIGRGQFTSFTRRVYLGDFSKPRRKPTPAEIARWKKKRRERNLLIRSSSIKKKKAYALRTADKFSSRLSHPRDIHFITSPFYTKRKIVHYYRKRGKIYTKKPRYRRHYGTDLRGRIGRPIYAMADGRVVVARRMYFEGNFTVIDHGNGIFTGYMHQSRLKVREGQRVRAGQLIGYTGNTGAGVGPHLHVSLRISGIYVEPLSLLSLPIRD